MQNGVYVIKCRGKIPYVYHWGILIIKNNERYVLHNSPFNQKNKFGGSIKKESFENFLKEYKPIFLNKTNLTEKEALKETTKLLNKPFNTITFNCNTYVSSIAKKFVPISVDNFLTFGFVFMLGFIVYKALNNK